MDNTKTAIEELQDTIKAMLNHGADLGEDLPALETHIKNAKEKEKQQIIHAYEEGQRAEAKQEFWTKGNKYYEETYNKN